MYRLKILNADIFGDRRGFDRALSMMGSARRDKVLRFTHPSSARTSLAAGVLLREELLSCGFDVGYEGANENSLKTGENGKLYLDEDGAPWFSLSHSGSYAVIALSREHRIGVDIEKVSGGRYSLSERFFAPEETRWLKEKARGDARESSRLFCRLWTMKEAYTKAWGTTLAENLKKSMLPYLEGAAGRPEGASGAGGVSEAEGLPAPGGLPVPEGTAGGDSLVFSFNDCLEAQGYMISVCEVYSQEWESGRHVTSSSG